MEMAWAPNVTTDCHHCLRQPDVWTMDGRSRSGWPKGAGRQTAEKKMKDCGLTWDVITKRAADRYQWVSLVEALCATWHKEGWVELACILTLTIVCSRTCWNSWRRCLTAYPLRRHGATSSNCAKPSTGATQTTSSTEVRHFNIKKKYRIHNFNYCAHVQFSYVIHHLTLFILNCQSN